MRAELDRSTSARRIASAALLIGLSQPTTIAAAEPPAPRPKGDVEARRATDGPARRAPWLRRYPGARGIVELGLFAGVLLPPAAHELYDYMRPWRSYSKVAGDLGARVGYAALSFLGVEAELALMPGSIADGGGSALLYGARAHALLRLPIASVAPFAVIGGGVLGARSEVLGADVDPALHFGGGLAFALTRFVSLRVDVRGSVSPGRTTAGARVITPEVLVGVSTTLRRPARDSDHDGFYDPGERAQPVDACPFDAGVAAHRGCPDRDRDGLRDADDRCPLEPGVRERSGCPPLRDGDGDTFWDPDQVDISPPGADACPEVAGHPEYEGCPAPDRDGDGLVDPDDRCPDEPETVNGFQDDDGCPDALPIDVAGILGKIQGINFEFMSATITVDSRPILDRNAAVLRDHPLLLLEIQGHTDADGDPTFNRALSQRRAEAVRLYMIDAGLAAERLRAVGYGGDRPIADNATEAGRAENRRIELRLLDARGQVLEVEGGRR